MKVKSVTLPIVLKSPVEVPGRCVRNALSCLVLNLLVGEYVVDDYRHSSTIFPENRTNDKETDLIATFAFFPHLGVGIQLRRSGKLLRSRRHERKRERFELDECLLRFHGNVCSFEYDAWRNVLGSRWQLRWPDFQHP